MDASSVAAVAPAVEDSRAALCQALLDRERLAMAVEDRDSFLAQRHFSGSMQLRPYVQHVSQLPPTWQAAYEARHEHWLSARDALEAVQVAHRQGDARRVDAILSRELDSDQEMEEEMEEAEEGGEEEAAEEDAILEEVPIVPFSGVGYRLGD